MKIAPFFVSLLFCTPAFAQQAKDAVIVTGPNFQQLPIGTLPVTPTGGIQMTLSQALAFGANLTMPGPIGSVTPNTGAFTTLSANGAVTFTGAGTGLTVNNATTLKGQAFLGNGADINFPTSPNYSGTAPLFVKTQLSGTKSIIGMNPISVIWVPVDSAVTSSGNISGLGVNMSMTSGSAGFRNGVNVTMNVNGTGIFDADVLPFVGTGTVQVNVGGVDTTQSGAKGIAWGSNFVAQALGTATNLRGVVGMEIDVVAADGTSMHDKHGISVIQLPAPGATVAGPQGVTDYALGVSNSSNPALSPVITTPAWKAGLLFGLYDGWWPFDTNSAIIQAIPSVDFLTTGMPAGFGIDFIAASFSNSAIRTRGFSVDGSGNTQIGAGVVAPIGTGMSIDASGVIATAAAVSAAGTGYHIGDLIMFDNGGMASVTTVSGTGVTTLTIINYPVEINAAAEPSNPVATTTWSRGTGTGLTLNLTWDASRTTLSLQPSGGPLRGGSGMFAANGSVATTMTSLGPAGSHTTVQEWFKITDASGTVRYIPAY